MEPHRRLYARTPRFTGDDVAALQAAANKRAKSRGIEPTKADGIYGGDTARIVREVAYALGALESTITKGATVGIQRLIRDPQARTAGQRRRAEQRKKKRAPGRTPKIVRLQVPMTNQFGPRGGWLGIVGHYTAGPRDQNDAHGLAMLRSYNAQHRRQGWGAIGYYACLLSSGTVVLCRPAGWKGAHVAGANTGRLGVVVCGGPGQRMTAEQRASLRWLHDHGHTTAMPESHRLPSRPPRVWVHRDLNATACPGAYASDYKDAA